MSALHKKKTNDNDNCVNCADCVIPNEPTNHDKGHKCSCGRTYKYVQGLYKHKKICQYKPFDSESASLILASDIEFKSAPLRGAALNSPIEKIIIEQSSQPLMNTIASLVPQDYNLMAELIKQNNELQRQIIEMTKENKIVTTNTNSNNSVNTTNNNQFNLNLFLNENCKNAINFSEFIENIQVSSDDLENNAKMGFVVGMTKIIVDNLKQMALNDRPIHCSDVKRETIYVKEENQWDKENSTKVIQRGIQDITCKNMQQLCQWREDNPEYTDYDSDLSELSMVMQQNSMAGPKRDEYYSKIVKNLAKESVIEKTSIV